MTEERQREIKKGERKKESTLLYNHLYIYKERQTDRQTYTHKQTERRRKGGRQKRREIHKKRKLYNKSWGSQQKNKKKDTEKER